MRTPMLVVLLGVSQTAAAVCVDWKAMGKYADIEAATVVFEGVVERIEQGDVATCRPDLIVFSVDRVWKGKATTKHTLHQPAASQLGGTAIINRECLIWGESDRFNTVGARYIVFASGPAERLVAMGCRTSKSPTKSEQQRLESWVSQTSKK